MRRAIATTAGLVAAGLVLGLGLAAVTVPPREEPLTRAEFERLKRQVERYPGAPPVWVPPEFDSPPERPTNAGGLIWLGATAVGSAGGVMVWRHGRRGTGCPAGEPTRA